MKNFWLVLILLVLCSCKTRYDLVYVDENGQNVYRTLCRKDETTCLVNAAKACDGKYKIIDWVERGYEYRPTITEAAIAITNTAATKKTSNLNSGSVTRKEVLIFSCKE